MADEVIKDVFTPCPDIVRRILEAEKQRETLYPEKSVLEQIDEMKVAVQDEKFEKMLGKILDKLELADKFIEVMPLYYDEAGNWWRWDLIDFYWRMCDETDILVLINKAAEVNVISSKEKTEIMNALRLRARSNKPKDLGTKMIQFKKEIVDLETGDRFPASSKYFLTAPIPYRLGRTGDTPKFDKLFAEWVKPTDVPVLYEILAYCLLAEYPIERIFALIGSGANGKSTFLKILYNFIGVKNVCTTSLEAISKSRFETTRLYKKLACIIAETNLNNLENSQLIKRLVSGKDLIPIEFKGKGLLEFINYAKLIIATNNLPPTDDKTDGFYRRWKIIEFPNQFEKEIDVLYDIGTEDYEALATKCLSILDGLLHIRSFSNEGNISERKAIYEAKSNPFEKFWSEKIDDSDPNGDLFCYEFAAEFNSYCRANHVREFSPQAIKKAMGDKGISQVVKKVNWTDSKDGQSKAYRVWTGIRWKT